MTNSNKTTKKNISFTLYRILSKHFTKKFTNNFNKLFEFNMGKTVKRQPTKVSALLSLFCFVEMKWLLEKIDLTVFSTHC